MNLATILESDACRNLALTLVHFVWQGAIIAVAATVVLALLRRSSAQSRYLTCCVSLLLMAMCVPVTFWVVTSRDSSGMAGDMTRNASTRASAREDELLLLEKLWRRHSPDSGEGNAEGRPVPSASNDFRGFEEGGSSTNGEKRPTKSADLEPSPNHGTSSNLVWSKLAGLVSCAYLLGFLVMAGRLFCASYGGRRLGRESVVINDPKLDGLVRESARALRIRWVPLVALTKRISSPVVIGLLRPIILLPASVVTGLSAEQLPAVIVHELAHIRRYDHVVLMLQRLAEALLFYHPAVWIVSRRMRIERERCCDDAVLAAGTRRMTYVESLLRVAELRLLESGSNTGNTAALAVVDDPSQLRRRIARLLDEPLELTPRLTRVGTVAVLLVMVVALLSPAILQSRASQPAEEAEVSRPDTEPKKPSKARPRANPESSAVAVAVKDNGANDSRPESRISVSKETTFVTGPLTEDGFVDYRAAINQHFSKGVTAENNAVVSFMQAIGPHPESADLPDEFFNHLGVTPLPEEGAYLIQLGAYTRKLAKSSDPPQDFEALWKKVEEQFHQTRKAPWQAEDFPLIDGWLRQNKRPLAIAVEGTKRPRYFHPWTGKADDALYAQLLPMPQTLRSLARLLCRRAMQRMGEGDLDGAWEDLMAVHRLARLVSQGPTLIEFLIGIAIEYMACQDGRILAQHEKLTAEQARRMQRELASLPPIRSPAECVNFAERLSLLDVIQHLARQSGKEVEALQAMYFELSAENSPAEQFAALKKLTKATPIRWNIVFRNTNGWFDRTVAAMRKTDEQENEAALAQLDTEARELGKAWTELPKLGRTFPNGVKNPEQRLSEHVANGLAYLFLPAVQTCTIAESRAASHFKATQLTFALTIYRLEHDKYPAKLDQLAPRYVNVVPKDQLGNDIGYSSDGVNYTFRVTDPAKTNDIVVSTPDRSDGR